MARGADDKGIAETNVKHVLDRRAGVRAGLHDDARILALGQASAQLRVLVDGDEVARNEALITLLEGFPHFLWILRNFC